MIKLIRENGKTCPVMICDYCDEEIKDYKLASLIWDPDNINDFKFVHKDCDSMAGKGRYSYFMEMGHFLGYLTNNLNLMTQKQFKDAKEGVSRRA